MDADRIPGFAAFLEIAALAGETVHIVPHLVVNSAVIVFDAMTVQRDADGAYQVNARERFIANGVLVTLAPT